MRLYQTIRTIFHIAIELRQDEWRMSLDASVTKGILIPFENQIRDQSDRGEDERLGPFLEMDSYIRSCFK